MFRKPRELKRTEKEFLEKMSVYFIENCHSIYGVDYLPRLAQRICKTRNIDLQVSTATLIVNSDSNSHDISYAVNLYKDYLIDLNLFVVKKAHKEIFSENHNLPPYLLFNTKNEEELPNGIGYALEKLILKKEYQTNEVVVGDNLLLAVYNDAYASMIAEQIDNYQSIAEPNSLKIRYISGFNF